MHGQEMWKKSPAGSVNGCALTSTEGTDSSARLAADTSLPFARATSSSPTWELRAQSMLPVSLGASLTARVKQFSTPLERLREAPALQPRDVQQGMHHRRSIVG